MAFDPTTAYGDEHQWMPFVEDVTWQHGEESVTGIKAKWADSGPSDIQSAAAGLGYTTEAAAVVVWQPTPTDVDQEDREPTFTPKPGDVLRRSTNEGWVVRDVIGSRFGHWSLACTREVENA